MNWQLAEHIALGVTVAVIVVGSILLWRESVERKALDAEMDEEAFKREETLRAEVLTLTDQKKQLEADLTECRDQHVTKAAQRPLNDIEPGSLPPRRKHRT